MDAKAKIKALMSYFGFIHLPMALQAISEPFANLATYIDANLPNSEEKYQALRKLLEAKDCAVRAQVG